MKLISGLVAVAAVALVAYVIGARSGERPNAVPPGAKSGSPTRNAKSDVPTPDAATTQMGMDRQAFWELLADTRAAAGNDTGRQSELLEERLSRLPAQQIVEFQRIRRRLDEQAYTWDVWGAAYVIEDGCSDDCFRDFRGYLISLGRRLYGTALRDPDALAPIVQDAEQGDWENADSVAGDAYASATGRDFPGEDSDLAGDPRGDPWDDEDQEALVQRYPRLASRFR